MLKIRLKRVGRKKKPTYRIALMKNLSKRDGKSIKDLGFYDPLKKKIKLNLESIHYYLNKGAYPTATVANLIRHYI